MKNPLEGLKDISKRLLKRGVEVVAQETDTELFEERTALLQRVTTAAAETHDLADRLEADASPHKQRLAARLRQAVDAAYDEATTGPHRAGEARGAVEADPFANGSQPSLNGSTPSEPSLPGPTPKALPPAPAEPPRRKRGRPRKSS